jgi:MOSC domain-containing protein YiiM
MAEIVSTNISTAKGTRKKPVSHGIRLVVDHGVDGDAHADAGADDDRQVSLLAVESIDKMRAAGADVAPGDFAENITTLGLHLPALPIGTRLRFGDEVELEITRIGKKCHSKCDILKQVGDCIMPREGVFARVITGGTTRPGDEIILLSKK